MITQIPSPKLKTQASLLTTKPQPKFKFLPSDSILKAMIEQALENEKKVKESENLKL